MDNNKNINTPDKFQQKLTEVMHGLYELFELSKEKNLEPVSEKGVIRYFEDSGKTAFQASGQFNRPSEYLQSLLDMMRVNYEPHPLGTVFLNSNLCFLFDAIPETPFQLGYVSLTSEPNKPFHAFWEEDVLPYIQECGYSVDDASSIFAVATTGNENYGVSFASSIMSTLNSSFSVDEMLNLLAASAGRSHDAPTKEVYSGYCLDAALENKTRLSLWLFIDPQAPMVQ